MQSFCFTWQEGLSQRRSFTAEDYGSPFPKLPETQGNERIVLLLRNWTHLHSRVKPFYLLSWLRMKANGTPKLNCKTALKNDVLWGFWSQSTDLTGRAAHNPFAEKVWATLDSSFDEQPNEELDPWSRWCFPNKIRSHVRSTPLDLVWMHVYSF